MESTRPAADLPDVDLSGRQVGGYRLLRRLGRGAMAEVYLAEQTSLRRQVALKVLRSNLANDETFVQRFHLEAQAAASLVHANIVQIHEVGRADGIHFIAQEYVQGLNLHELLVRRGPPDVKQAVAIMRQTAAALHKAAELGIVHRDIKPENIMLAASGEVKVADFGLARATRGGEAVNLTQAGFTMGTPLYMSPEQVEGKPLDPRSDIYSFGVTCYHMLAGEPPFRGETALGVAVQHLKNQPQRLENLRPDLPPALCRIVHKMLAKSPSDRYATAQELSRELRALPIVGLPEDDGEDLKGLAGEGASTISIARQAATERLAVLMRTSAMPVPSRWRHRLVLASVLAAFSAGAALAWVTRELPLLTSPPTKVANNDANADDATTDDDSSEMERRDSAEAQFIYAVMVDNEDAWLSVERFYPENQNLVRRAKQQLARLYLQEDDYERALQLFNEFAEMPEVEVQFRAFGLAGQAIVLASQGKKPLAAEKLAALLPLRQNLDPQMQALVARLLRKQGAALGVKPEKWKAWMNKPATDASPSQK